MGTGEEGTKKLGAVGAVIAAIGMVVARGADDCGRLGAKGLSAAGHAAPAVADDALRGAGKAAALGDDALHGAGKGAALGDDALHGAGKGAARGENPGVAAHASDGAHTQKVIEARPSSAADDVSGKVAEQGLSVGLEVLPGGGDEEEDEDAAPPAPGAPGASSADAGAGTARAPAPPAEPRRATAK